MIGAGGVGKTAYLTRITTGSFIFKHTPTAPAVKITDYQTLVEQRIGKNSYVQFEVLESINYIDGDWDAIIGMFDRTDRESFDYLVEQIKQFPRGVPVVYVGNKVDKEEMFADFHKLLYSAFNLKTSMYFDISAKSNFNFEKPFLVLSRHLMKDPVLEFIEYPDDEY